MAGNAEEEVFIYLLCGPDCVACELQEEEERPKACLLVNLSCFVFLSVCRDKIRVGAVHNCAGFVSVDHRKTSKHILAVKLVYRIFVAVCLFVGSYLNDFESAVYHISKLLFFIMKLLFCVTDVDGELCVWCCYCVCVCVCVCVHACVCVSL